MRCELPDADATEQLGARLAESVRPAVIYLRGDLGAGKTTLVRGLIHALGYTGRVRSPTYTLVEPYACEPCPVFHLDLYRLADPEELEWLGLRDMLGEPALLIVEWPERGSGVLPPADLTVYMEYSGNARLARLVPATEAGKLLLGTVRSRTPDITR
ncbi:MAG: tRNA (adenosine(37)-N6)-threonylcarbamoyltransferase complex ATPase subunit type 1 TsaE [Gammaproteobacteria bacterium]|jgi:tRNA threonylcarbamoyladenosine biosynthesis protein TsaE|nr:tRNA (adenosine(37)-N6)-threonylcarbamoyltransferase complex ATPase subunit type 1 TsaE [Gammaproteobacteria bacterium]